MYDGYKQIEEHVITERYVGMREKEIVTDPEMWMWSHSNWTCTPPAEVLEQKI